MTSDITNNERSLGKLRNAKKYYQSHLPFHLIAVYLAYFSYVYLKGDDILVPKTLATLVGLLLGLILIYLAVCRWYSYLIARREKWAEKLKAKHQDLLSQLKEKTNFDKTKDLLVRFGDGEDIELMEKQLKEITEKKEKYKAMLSEADSKGDAKAQIMADLRKNEAKGAGYYQMMIDALLGDDEMSPDHRYALICEQCHQHNGLAPPGQLPTKVAYICPRCGKQNNFPSQEAPVDETSVEKTVEKTSESEEQDDSL